MSVQSGRRSPHNRLYRDAVHSSRTAWIATETGRVRANNEDRCFVGEWVSDGSDGAWTVSLDAKVWGAAVADGMGGHQAGELASAAAISELHLLIGALDNENAARAAIERVNERVFREMHTARGRSGMGCTMTGVAARGSEAIFFNVGDSRAYIFRDGAILQQSVDHTLGGQTSSHRRSHLLTQSIGGTLRRVALAPHVKSVRLVEMDLILLCSDGLTDMLSEDEVIETLRRNPSDPARTLATAAIDAGGHDNVTVIVIGYVR